MMEKFTADEKVAIVMESFTANNIAERERGKSKVTSSVKFLRVYIIELLLAKRVEIRNYKTIF